MVKAETFLRVEIIERWSDQLWRLNNIYWIKPADGPRILFNMKPIQYDLYNEMWWMNIILKSRKHGCTTFFDLFALDSCLFNSDTRAGIVAHTLTDVNEIFAEKVKFPYDCLPDGLKTVVPATTDRANKLSFANGSTIRVATSIRSGDVNILHVSEFGKICAKYPEKAKEIVTGCFEAQQVGQITFVESTAEGQEGYFCDYCKTAQDMKRSGRQLSKLDFKFFFFAWMQKPENVLDPKGVAITFRDRQYFKKVEAEIGYKLSPEQKAWYVKKAQLLGDLIKREHPSTPEEAFEAAIEGAYYSAQFIKIREEGRICAVPHQEGVQVDTWWDLGMSDSTSIWFSQDVGREIHLVDYYENYGEGLLHYAKELNQKAHAKGWLYGRHVAPHDIKVRELGPGISRLEQAQKLVDPSDGKIYSIPFEVAPRIESEKDGWEAVRNILPQCFFDEENTTVKVGKQSVGLPSLEGYRKKWDEKLGSFRERPLHNWASHGAKAFETMAISHDYVNLAYPEFG